MSSHPISSGVHRIHMSLLMLTFISWLRLYVPGRSSYNITIFSHLYTIIWRQISKISPLPHREGGGKKKELLTIFTSWRTEDVLGWPKCLFGFFCKMLWKTPNELFGQPNIYIFEIFHEEYFLCLSHLSIFLQSFMSVCTHGHLKGQLSILWAIPCFSKQCINNKYLLNFIL